MEIFLVCLFFFKKVNSTCTCWKLTTKFDWTWKIFDLFGRMFCYWSLDTGNPPRNVRVNGSRTWKNEWELVHGHCIVCIIIILVAYKYSRTVAVKCAIIILRKILTEKQSFTSTYQKWTTDIKASSYSNFNSLIHTNHWIPSIKSFNCVTIWKIQIQWLLTMRSTLPFA